MCVVVRIVITILNWVSWDRIAFWCKICMASWNLNSFVVDFKIALASCIDLGPIELAHMHACAIDLPVESIDIS
jgi:hypothetical protein